MTDVRTEAENEDALSAHRERFAEREPLWASLRARYGVRFDHEAGESLRREAAWLLARHEALEKEHAGLCEAIKRYQGEGT